MKSFYCLPLAAAAILFAGCSQEQITPSINGKDGKVITITANAEAPVSTKATVTDKGVIAWSEGDQIGVFDIAKSTVTPFTYVSGSNKDFSATVAEGTSLDFAVAPYSEDEAVLDNGEFSIVFPGAYENYVPGTTNAPMIATSAVESNGSYTFNFKHLAALAKVTYKNVPVGTKTFYLEADNAIAGENSYNSTAEATEFTTPTTKAAKDVMLDLASAVTEPNQTMSFYVPIPVGTYANFKVSLLDAGSNTISLTAKQVTLPADEQSFRRAELYIFQTIVLPEASTALFYESFDKCSSTGGNDGSWSGSIASGTLSDDSTDNAGWTFDNGYAASKCIKLGTGSKQGTATTPALGIASTTATLTFKAGAWSGDATTLNLEIEGEGALSASSVTLSNASFTDYTVYIKDANENTKVKFSAGKASNNRFFLDEVKVVSGGDFKVAQTLSFSSTDVTAVLGEEFTEPTLSGAQTTDVTYSSSNTAVATVDASTGKVSLVGAGTTTITATAAATDDYLSGSVSYTLTVSDGADFTDIKGLKALLTGTSKSDAVTVTGTLTDAVVTYTNGLYAYLEDSSAGILVYTSSHGLTSGQSISGEVTATGYKYNGLAEVTTLTTTNATVSSGATIPCNTVTLATLNTDEGYATWESRRVKIVDASVTTTFNSTGTAVSGKISQNGSAIDTRVNKGITITKANVGSTIDLIAYPAIYYSTKQMTVWSDDDITVKGTKGVISVTGQPGSVTVGTSTTFTASVTSGATISLTSSDTEETYLKVDVSKLASTGEVTLTGVSATPDGSPVTITLSAPANGDYEAADNVSFSVTVVEQGSEVTVQYTLDSTGSLQGKNSNYAGNCDIESDGITWNVTGNTTMNPWRIGGKKITSVDRAIYSKTPISSNISKIEITHGTASSITVNSMKVYVCSTAAGAAASTPTDVVATFNPTFAANSTVTLEKTDDTSWENCYYRIVYNVTVTGKSNRFIQFKTAKFYGK